jgi:hypothetical protein
VAARVLWTLALRTALIRSGAGVTAISAGALPRERAPVPAVPAGPVLRELAGLDDLELLAIFRSLPRSSGRRAAACEVLVDRHRGLVRSCARRYRPGTAVTRPAARGPELRLARS